MIETIRQGLEEDGFKVSISKLCRWFGVPRRTFYYRTVKAPPKLQERLVEPVKAMIEENPSFGYRTVAGLLGMNKNTVQRIFQIKGWQVRKRAVGFRPRIQALPSVAQAPNERWATDLCRIWAGKDKWCTLAVVIDCYSRELLGWQLSRSARAKTPEAALEHALIARFGTLGRVPRPFLLRSDNGLCSPAAAIPVWSEATACSRSSSPHTALSRTAWSSGSSARSRSSVPTGTGSNIPAARQPCTG